MDLREVKWEPISKDEADSLTNSLQLIINDTTVNSIQRLIQTENLYAGIARIKDASSPNLARTFPACLLGTDDGDCLDPDNRVQLQRFNDQIQSMLVKLACSSKDVAHGIIRQLPIREGLGVRLEKSDCPGLQNLSAADRSLLHAPRTTDRTPPGLNGK